MPNSCWFAGRDPTAPTRLKRAHRVDRGQYLSPLLCSQNLQPGSYSKLKTKADARTNGVAVILVRVGLVSIVVRISPIIVRLMVPIIFVRVITMNGAPSTDPASALRRKAVRLPPRGHLGRHRKRSFPACWAVPRSKGVVLALGFNLAGV